MKKLLITTDRRSETLSGVLYCECPLLPGRYVAWADWFLSGTWRWVVPVPDGGDWSDAERKLGMHDHPWMPIIRFEVVED